VYAKEPVGEDPALQEASELSLDKTWRWATAVTGPGEKRLELLGDDLVQDSFVCPAGIVGARGDASGSNGGVEGPRRRAVAMLAR
jgi:hypothetical protein